MNDEGKCRKYEETEWKKTNIKRVRRVAKKGAVTNIK
jgi:hypothetical protein